MTFPFRNEDEVAGIKLPPMHGIVHPRPFLLFSQALAKCHKALISKERVAVGRGSIGPGVQGHDLRNGGKVNRGKDGMHLVGGERWIAVEFTALLAQEIDERIKLVVKLHRTSFAAIHTNASIAEGTAVYAAKLRRFAGRETPSIHSSTNQPTPKPWRVRNG